MAVDEGRPCRYCGSTATSDYRWTGDGEPGIPCRWCADCCRVEERPDDWAGPTPGDLGPPAPPSGAQ